MMRSGEILIGGHNWQQHAAAVPDGCAKGLVPRDYDTHPRGFYSSMQAVDFPTIPRAEWPERLRDLIARKALLSDVMLGRNVPCLDQNGRGYCHTADTEVLTEKGWVAWPEYNYTDLLATVSPATGAMEFQAPFERHVYEYDGEMVHSTNRRLDFGVTPDHRMMVRKWDEAKRTLSDEYTFQRAGEIGWYAGFMNAPRGWLGTELVEVEVPGDRRYDGDDFVALLSLIVSDGFAASYEHSGDLVSFASFRPECRDRVAALAARLGFREQPSRPGVWNRWGARALAQWIFANCYVGGGLKAQHKRVPDLVKVASRRQIEHFLTWNGDQNHNRAANGEHYYSASKRMIDDLQELCLRVGRRGTITHRGPRTGVMPQGITSTSRESWELVVGRTDNLCIDRKKHIETDRYKGLVYCAAVPNSTLITRRNGSVLISGNCWAHSTVGAVQAARAVMNEPTIGLSAYSVACVIKNFRDQGGWGAESADFIATKGVCDETVWPQRGASQSLNTPAAWENAKKYRLTAQLADMRVGQYDRNLTFDQYATCWLLGCPTVDDHNWWGHSIMGCDLVDGATQWRETRDDGSGKLLDLVEFDLAWGMGDPVTAGYGGRIRNSWGASWGSQGFGVLAGSKAVPDGGVGVMIVTAS